MYRPGPLAIPTHVECMGIIERTMLVKVSAGENSNKFYEVTLDASGTVTKRWGRVGADGQTCYEHSGEAGYHRVIQSKMGRGYRKVDLVDGPTPGRVRNLVEVAQRRIPAKPKTKAKGASDELMALIARWCQANRHNIESTSGGHITVSDTGVVKTALGAVSGRTVSDARMILDRISNATGVPVGLVNEYLSLIPQEVGRTRGWEDRFASPAELARQKDFLDALEASTALAGSVQDSNDDAEFRYTLARIGNGSAKFKEIERRYDRSKNSRHTSSGLRLVSVHKIEPSDPAESETWKKHADDFGNVRRLWHGTGEHNIISILHRGIIIPPTSGGTYTTTGRMFGDGIYLSDQSTKALNYSHGYWSGGARRDNCFMFLADAVMGHELRPKTPREAVTLRSSKFQSINVKGGTCNVVNNEMVVWNPEQIRLSYLCEFAI